MQNLSSWTQTAGHSTPTRAQRFAPRRALQAANAQAHTEIAILPEAPATDPRGQTLRMLRQQLNLDPVELATEACISLRQLYQLETGESTLFYNKALRNQAGRRVASILGVGWDDLGKLPPPATPDKTLKVVNLYPTPPVASMSVRDDLPTPPATELPPIGLEREATATLTLPTPTTAQTRLTTSDPAPQQPPRPSRWHWTLIAWTLSAALGAATGWLISTQAHLRQPLLELLRQPLLELLRLLSF